MMSPSHLVLEALENQDLEGLAIQLKKALEEDDEAVLLELGYYLEGTGFLSEAEEIFIHLLPHYPELALNLATIAGEDGDVERAFAYLEEISPSNPYYVEALLIKADLYQSEGLADVAKDKLLEASQLSDDELISFGLAEMELELGHYRSAIEAYAGLDNRSIYRQTGVSTYQRIGYAYAHLGKFEAAIEFLEKAVALEYDDHSLFELAVLLFEQGEYQRANLYFKQLMVLNADFQGYHAPYAQSLHAEHQTEAALHLLQAYLVKDESNVPILLLASQYAYELKDSRLAEEYLLKAKPWAEDLGEIELRLSSLYLEQGRYEAILSLQGGDTAFVLTRWHMAKACRALDQKESELLYRELVKELQDNPDFLREYIFVLRESGDFLEAKHQLERYLRLVPDDLEMSDLAID